MFGSIFSNVFSSVAHYVIMGLIVVIIMLSAGSYWYFSYSQEQISVLTANSVKLEQAVKTQERVIQEQLAAQERTNREVIDLQTRLSGAERTRRELEVRLRRQNLESSARTRRAETEQEINLMFQEQLRAFETLSGTVASNPNATSATPNQPPPRPPVRRSP